MLIAVNYHYIRESFEAPYPAIFGKTPAELRSQLEQLGKAGSFVSADQECGFAYAFTMERAGNPSLTSPLKSSCVGTI